jgi:hypothetical protein
MAVKVLELKMLMLKVLWQEARSTGLVPVLHVAVLTASSAEQSG